MKAEALTQEGGHAQRTPRVIRERCRSLPRCQDFFFPRCQDFGPDTLSADRNVASPGVSGAAQIGRRVTPDTDEWSEDPPDIFPATGLVFPPLADVLTRSRHQQ